MAKVAEIMHLCTVIRSWPRMCLHASWKGNLKGIDAWDSDYGVYNTYDSPDLCLKGFY